MKKSAAGWGGGTGYGPIAPARPGEFQFPGRSRSPSERYPADEKGRYRSRTEDPDSDGDRQQSDLGGGSDGLSEADAVDAGELMGFPRQTSASRFARCPHCNKMSRNGKCNRCDVKFAWRDQLPGGKADKKTPSDFDPDELALGIPDEMEHTSDPDIATEIAMDHLVGDKDYYSSMQKDKKAAKDDVVSDSEDEPADRYTFAGFDVVIENPAGSVRTWKSKSGESGETTMLFDYGYLDGYMGVDKDELDVYIGPDEDAEFVHVVHQMKQPDFEKPDEDKTMLGFSGADEAKDAYLAHFDDDRFFGGMSVMRLEDFRSKLDAQKKPKRITNMKKRATDDYLHDEHLRAARSLAWDVFERRSKNVKVLAERSVSGVREAVVQVDVGGDYVVEGDRDLSQSDSFFFLVRAEGDDNTVFEVEELGELEAENMTQKMKTAASKKRAALKTVDGVEVEEFRSSGAAYDACQTRLPNGVILYIPSERVVGISDTWPIALTKNTGELHRLAAGVDIETVEDGKFADAARRAQPLVDKMDGTTSTASKKRAVSTRHKQAGEYIDPQRDYFEPQRAFKIVVRDPNLADPDKHAKEEFFDSLDRAWARANELSNLPTSTSHSRTTQIFRATGKKWNPWEQIGGTATDPGYRYLEHGFEVGEDTSPVTWRPKKRAISTPESDRRISRGNLDTLASPETRRLTSKSLAEKAAVKLEQGFDRYVLAHRDEAASFLHRERGIRTADVEASLKNASLRESLKDGFWNTFLFLRESAMNRSANNNPQRNVDEFPTFVLEEVDMDLERKDEVRDLTPEEETAAGLIDEQLERRQVTETSKEAALPPGYDPLSRFAGSYGFGYEKTASDDELPVDLFSNDDDSAPQADRTLAALTVSRAMAGRPHVLSRPHRLVDAAADKFLRVARKELKGYTIEAKHLARINTEEMASNGQLVLGSLEWHVRLANHVGRRRVAVTLIQPVIGGEPSDEFRVLTSSGKEVQLRQGTLDRLMGVRRDAQTVSRRISKVDLSHIEE